MTIAADNGGNEGRVAVLVDCDNTSPEILEYALSMVAQFGRVVVRRGYGNHATLANKWQDALVRLAFTPCLQYQYASGKNTSDIALALDAMEDLFEQRPKSLLAAVALLAAESAEDWVHLGALGNYLRRSDSSFTPKKYGHSGLLEMIDTCPDLETHKEGGAHWVKPKEAATKSR